MAALRGLLTTEEAAERLGVAQSRIYQWIAEGRLKATRVGAIYLVDAVAVGSFTRRPTGRPKKPTARGRKGKPRSAKEEDSK